MFPQIKGFAPVGTPCLKVLLLQVYEGIVIDKQVQTVSAHDGITNARYDRVLSKVLGKTFGLIV